MSGDHASALPRRGQVPATPSYGIRREIPQERRRAGAASLLLRTARDAVLGDGPGPRPRASTTRSGRPAPIHGAPKHHATQRLSPIRLHAGWEGGPDALRVPGLYDPVDLNEDDEDDDLVPST